MDCRVAGGACVAAMVAVLEPGMGDDEPAVIEDEIATIVGGHNPLNAAGRTDAGVHAAAQVASITVDHPIPPDELLKALNARLKAGDIRLYQGTTVTKTIPITGGFAEFSGELCRVLADGLIEN
jgi:hypothetical protein